MKVADVEELKNNFCRSEGCKEPYCVGDGDSGVCYPMQSFLAVVEASAVDAIPVPFIINRIRETGGAESSYLSRLIRRYREVYHA